MRSVVSKELPIVLWPVPVVPSRGLRNWGVDSLQRKGTHMDASTPHHVDYAALNRLGDEIAELSAHLEAATARLLELIREFDEQGGWNTGFTSCAAWLSWRCGMDLGAA